MEERGRAEQQVNLSRPRLLMTQTGAGLSAEARVLHGLLQHAQSAAQYDILLFQGVRSGGLSPTLEVFSALPDVTIRMLPVGNLSMPGRGKMEQALKLLDVMRLRLSIPFLIRQAQPFLPDLVYSAQQRWDTVVAGALSHAMRIPYMIHLHYNVGPWLGEGALRALRQADMIVAVSDAVRDGAIEYGLAPDRIVTLYNSVNVPPPLNVQDRELARQWLRNELDIAPTSIILGMVARLSEWKGQHEALEAALSIMESHPELYVVFAGQEDDPQAGIAKRLEEMASTAGFSDRLRLLGPRSDVARLLDSFDIFIHPSRHDPCPLAVLEAMAHGLPVVAWREGGIAYLVEDDLTGLLVEPLHIAGLTAAIARLLNSPDLCATMGSAGRQRAATVFNPDAMTQSFREIVERVVSMRSQV